MMTFQSFDDVSRYRECLDQLRRRTDVVNIHTTSGLSKHVLQTRYVLDMTIQCPYGSLSVQVIYISRSIECADTNETS